MGLLQPRIVEMEQLLQLPLKRARTRNFGPASARRRSLPHEESDYEVEEGGDEENDGENYDCEEDCWADFASES